MLVILASGHTVWGDLSKVPGFDPDKWSQSFDLMAVNDVGMHVPYKLAHWYSNDPWLAFWAKARRPHFPNQEGPRGARAENIRFHSWQRIEGLNVEIHDLQGGGTSTLNACYLGKKLYPDSPIYVCGAPMDSGPHYFDPPWIKSSFDNTHELGIWQSAKPDLAGVISMSGNTRKILGD